MSSKKIENGRYWEVGLQLVDGCTPCSPGCEHCWSAGMTKRFYHEKGCLVDIQTGRFTGKIITNTHRLDIPLKRRKPTVYAVWNDLFHEAVQRAFIGRVYFCIDEVHQHTFLILTKRPQRMAEYIAEIHVVQNDYPPENVWHGLTVCNQQETDEKIPVFLQVPGKKFLSIEPCLSHINVLSYLQGGNNYDRERTGVYDSGSTRCLQCRQRRKCMASRQDDGRKPQRNSILHQDVQLSPKRSHKHEERLSDGDVFARTSEEIRSSCSSGRLDDCKSFGYPERNGDQSQGRKTREPSPLEPGDGDSLTEHASFNQEQAREEGCVNKTDRWGCDRDQAAMGTGTNDTVCDSGALSHKSISSGIHCPKKNMEASSIGCVILGGETGPGARPMHPDWVRSIRDQCAVSNTPFYFKQWGDDFFKIRKISKKIFGSIRTLDGRTHDDLPWRVGK